MARRRSVLVANSVALALAGLLSLGALGCRAEPTDLEAMMAEIRAEYPEVPRISVEELAARLEAGEPVLLLDTRDASEYAVSHLEGAVHAETVDLAVVAIATADVDGPVVLYCSVGYRSADLARELLASSDPLLEGHELLNLEGSIFAWANSGRPVYRDGRKVAKVHPYDKKWGKLLRSDLRAEP